MKKVIVIGSGFAGLSAACSLASEGLDVTVLEKNAIPGGRARKFESNGFLFDMGPSWYWMPDVFEKFFARFGRRVDDFYKLQRLDPSYRVFFGNKNFYDVPSGIPALHTFFESIEPGSSEALSRFLKDGAYKYDTGMNNLVYKPGISWRELADPKMISAALRLNIFESHSKYVRRFFKDPRLVSILEFPVLFLGAAPDKIPALYSLMNYADMALGTWYPMGGMYKIIEGIVQLAKELGVKFSYNSAVTNIAVENGVATGVHTDETFHRADYVVASADYQHVEQKLLPEKSRTHSHNYWDTRTLAPSCLIYFVGVNKKLNNLQHHTLFFDQDMDRHIKDIYQDPQWPTAPQFYVSCPSKTDPLVAPVGSENLFILIPVAPGLADSEEVRERYFNLVIQRMENITGQSIASHVSFKRSYAHNDFVSDYNAFKGNAYGLANTLLQTANFKPAMTSRRVSNLFYAGQLTVPGPGVPPTLISGQVAASMVLQRWNREKKQSASAAV